MNNEVVRVGIALISAAFISIQGTKIMTSTLLEKASKEGVLTDELRSSIYVSGLLSLGLLSLSTSLFFSILLGLLNESSSLDIFEPSLIGYTGVVLFLSSVLFVVYPSAKIFYALVKQTSSNNLVSFGIVSLVELINWLLLTLPLMIIVGFFARLPTEKKFKSQFFNSVKDIRVKIGGWDCPVELWFTTPSEDKKNKLSDRRQRGGEKHCLSSVLLVY